MYTLHVHSLKILVLLDECITLWGEPEWVHAQNVDQLHAHDCHQNVTEPQAIHVQHRNCESGLATCKTCCTQAGPAHAAGNECGDGMDRWKHSSHLFWHALLEEVWVQWQECESGNNDKRHWQITLSLKPLNRLVHERFPSWHTVYDSVSQLNS